MIRRFLKIALLGTSMAHAALAQVPFTPDDPYFSPYDGPVRPDLPSPGFYGQWHLVNQMPLSAQNVGLDANLAGAWARGLTGAGVVIGIVDEGVQPDHPDLMMKYLPTYSFTFTRTVEENAADGFVRGAPLRIGPGFSGDNHGTAVAGVAAAMGGNGIGVTGAAPYAAVSSLKLLGGGIPSPTTFEQAHAAAILFQGQTDELGRANPYVAYAPPPGQFAPVRVKNHSYAFTEAFLDAGSEVKDALALSASWGVINVVSAGNERLHNSTGSATEDANKSGLASSPHVITVAALGADGKYADYSGFGANVFVTAPSGISTSFDIVTTDTMTSAAGYNNTARPDPYLAFSNPGPNDGYSYSSSFDGTSASAPLVAGIMALGVQANPNMTVRMAQHLLVRTSRLVDPTDTVSPSSTGGWVINGAGHHFNNNYGFGLIDADAFTLAAANVVGLTELETYSSGDQIVDRSFSTSDMVLTETLVIAFQEPLPLEYVQVHFTISGLQADWRDYSGTQDVAGIGAIAGDLEAWLTSPSGTKNRLFLDDRGVPLARWETSRSWENLETLDWTFTSYAYWGENLNGLWTVDLINHSTNESDLGQWGSYRIDFGTGDVSIVPEPSVILLLVVGLPFLVLLRLRRARNL